MRSISYFTIFFFFLQAVAQDLPQDYLKADFHKGRREAVRKMMPTNSVAVFFSNPIRNRSNDVDFKFHQDPDFYYLTGYKEPNAVLLIFSENQRNTSGDLYNETIFVQKHDPRAELWNGTRLGVKGVKEKLGFNHVYTNERFSKQEINFSKFSKVLFFEFNEDVRDTGSKSDLFDLIKHFKIKANYPSNYTAVRQYVYNLIAEKGAQKTEVKNEIKPYMDSYPFLKEDAKITQYLDTPDNAAFSQTELKSKFTLNISSNNLDTRALNVIMSTLRETKTEEELKLLKKAIEISAVGQVEIMKAMHPGMSEAEIQGIHEYVYKRYGAEHEGYPSIVGSGHNGCVLHYIENNRTEVGNDLVLMDLGAEYHGYTADITRTIPANGKFSKEQRIIYDIVYKAQEAGIKASVIGAAFWHPGQIAKKIIAEELVKIGIIAKEDEVNKYFPHGTSHYLGLDVHDKGTYGSFKENTVITVEPGIYIPEGSNCDKKWWGIAIRIEDDILITKNGPINLSKRVPRRADEIEKMMARKSPLDNFKLPDLNKD